MHRAQVMRGGAVLFVLAAFVGIGVALRATLTASEPDARTKVFQSRTRRALDELARDGHMKRLDIGEQREFLEENEPGLRAHFDRLWQEQRLSTDALARLIESTYSKEELELVVPTDPRTSELFMFIGTRYDGGPYPIPIDGGEWPDYFRRSRFGLGADNAYKEVVYEAVLAFRARRNGKQ